MENQKRVLPQWLLDLNGNNPPKKCRSTNTRENTRVMKGPTPEDVPVRTVVDSPNRNKTSDSRGDVLQNSKSKKARKDRLELSSSDDETSKESCVTDVKEGNENEVVSVDSNPPSPSIVQSVPSACSADDVDNDPSNPQVEQREVTPSGGGASIDDNSTSTGLVRPICTYGDKCYRKNPQHKVDFSHPGDDDFTSVDDRPECEYGLSCYRKNPLHRQHYKHTKKVLKPRKAKRPGNTSVNDNSSDEDDYDLEDPFINDDSSDDYQPEGSDDDTDLSNTSTIEKNQSND